MTFEPPFPAFLRYMTELYFLNMKVVPSVVPTKGYSGRLILVSKQNQISK